MFVSELARRIGRTPETVKRWIKSGLLECDRDEHNRRVFSEAHVERCLELARLGLKAQVEQRKLADVAADQPEQLSLVLKSSTQRKQPRA